MSAQWENFLKNLGEWHGSFTAFSPDGDVVKDTPSILSLVGKNNNQTVELTLRYLPPDEPSREVFLEYQNIPSQIMFFETGAFSQGSFQWGPFAEFGAEFGLIEGMCRLRLVQLFNRESRCDRLTLIREKRAGNNPPERPPLTVEQLFGEWQGEATTFYPDLSPPQTYSTHLKIEAQSSDRVQQTLSFDSRTITSTAQIQDSKLLFDRGNLPVQVLLLPDGASSNCPVEIKPGYPFVLEVGWLLEPNRRQRLIRSYSDRGKWLSATFVREQKI